MKLWQVLLLSFVVLAAGCTGKRVEQNAVQPVLATDIKMQDMAGKSFVLSELNGKPFVAKEGKMPTLNFDNEMRVHGQICNIFSGGATLENGVLQSKAMIATRMFCPDQALNNLEWLFFSMMNSGAQLKLTNDGLILSTDSDVLTYKRALKQ